jgi:Proto-chlorophyllide reductase 57 kD subunit
MKFLCIDCDRQMEFEDRSQPGDGTFGAAFKCPACGRSIAMLANPMETQLVESLGVKIGGRVLDEQPLELVRSSLVGRDDAFTEAEESNSRPRRVDWSTEARERLERVPNFVRGMVKRIYVDYAREHDVECITPAMMDRARSELGLEGM